MIRSIPEDVRLKTLALATENPAEARRYLGKATGLKKSQRNELFLQIVAGEQPEPSDHQEGDYEVTVTTAKPQSLDEVVKLCQVDLTKWQPRGFAVDQRKTGFAWRVSFKEKVVPIDAEKMLEVFIAHSAKHAPKRFSVEPTKRGGKYLYHINCPDAHFGRLSWGRETGGADSDLSIQETDYKGIVTKAMGQAPVDQIDRIMFLVGSDYFQTDTINDTTSAGTPQDTDSRWYKSFEVGCKVATDVIESLASRFHVDVIVSSGNHDVMRSVYMGFYLQAFFRKHPNVTIDNSPTQRKYYTWGKNLLGLTHGSEEKITDLPMIMMREKQDIISQFKHLFWFIGHKHAEAVRTINGVSIFTVPSMAAPDAWTASKGYVGNQRGAQSFLLDKDEGLVAVYYQNLG